MRGVLSGRLSLLCTVAAPLLIALIACTAAGPGEGQAPQVPNKPTIELTIALPQIVQGGNWDPSSGVKNIEREAGLVYESLFIHVPPSAEVRPYLLEGAAMSPDGLSWTLTLREGTRFSDGEPLTAADVKFSLERYISPASRTPEVGTFRQAIKELVVLDNRTLKVALNQSLITLPSLLAANRSSEGIVVPKKHIDQVGWDSIAQRPMGSGAYKVTEYKVGDSVTFEAVENHWRSSPRFAKVRVFQIPEERTRVAMIRSGQADLVSDIGPEGKKELEGNGLSTIVVPNSYTWAGVFHGARQEDPKNPLQNMAVREALNLAIDKKAVLDGLWAGAGELASFGPNAPFALGAPKDLKPTAYQPDRAKTLLQQAGYPDGFPLTIYTVNGLCPLGGDRRLGEVMASYWEKIGIKATLRPIEVTAYTPMYTRGQQIAPELAGTIGVLCTSGTPVAINDLTRVYWSKGRTKSTDLIDTEIANAQTARSTEELVSRSQTAYKKLYDTNSMLPIFWGSMIYGTNKKMGEVPITTGVNNLFQWLIQERR